MLCYVTLCYVMLCYVVLCCVMLCYVMLCYVMLCRSLCRQTSFPNMAVKVEAANNFSLFPQSAVIGTG